MHFFEIGNIAFNLFGYSISFVELIGTLFGFISVYYASKANILTWGTGLINEVFFFVLFFQVQLYADMFLQTYFFVVTLYGWYHWKLDSTQKSITQTGWHAKIIIIALIIVGTLISGFLFTNLHLYLPAYFKLQAAYPYTDSLVMVLSIVATVLLAQKKIDNWYLWIVTDLICVVLYFKKGIYFLSFEYLIFLGLACYGLYNWRKLVDHD